MKIYFEEPTQVVAIIKDHDDFEKEFERIAGIAFEDKIICACCGGVFSIKEQVQKIESEYTWINFSEDIAPDAKLDLIVKQEEIEE